MGPMTSMPPEYNEKDFGLMELSFLMSIWVVFGIIIDSSKKNAFPIDSFIKLQNYSMSCTDLKSASSSCLAFSGTQYICTLPLVARSELMVTRACKKLIRSEQQVGLTKPPFLSLNSFCFLASAFF